MIAQRARLHRMLDEILEGLYSAPKSLPSKYFYDKRGAELFERICQLEEYYPTRTEISILEKHAGEIASLLGDRPILYEFGSGSSAKTRILLKTIDPLAGYVPIDICAAALSDATENLRHEFPKLPIAPLCADFSEKVELVDEITLMNPYSDRVVFFPGSTIGNLTPKDSGLFLARTAEALGPEGKLLIGIDLVKDPSILHKAYNDSAGVTRDFNLNILEHINRELGADFDLTKFHHLAFYNPGPSRIEMHLVCTQNCDVRIQGHVIPFDSGETIQTESSYKYAPANFISLAERSGFRFVRRWCDPSEHFGVFLFEA